MAFVSVPSINNFRQREDGFEKQVHTVKSVYTHHHWDPKIVDVVDKW